MFTHGIPFFITCVYLDDSLDIFWLCILYKIIEKHTKLSYIFHFSSQNLQDYHIFFQFLLRIYPLLTINSIKLSVFNVFYPFAIKTLTKKLLQLNEMQKKTLMKKLSAIGVFATDPPVHLSAISRQDGTLIILDGPLMISD